MSLTMKAADVQGDLVDSEIHGFHTLQDLDVKNIREEASARWLRPNEIHALLCNHRYFVIHVKPVNLPKSGTIVLFDRKMLRNFRKDGHNWKKKKDGKTVKEAHEHLKVGNVERIHVYYAHGLDNPTFVRRCYWLLDKSLEHIVLVHYRETQELQCSPSPSMNSNSGSVSDPSAPWLLPEELDSRGNQGYCVGENELSEPSDNTTVLNHELRLHEINTLDWDELLASNEPFNPTLPKGDKLFDQRHQVPNVANNLLGDIYSFGNPIEPIGRSTNNNISSPESAYVSSIGGQMNLNVDSREFTLVNSGNSLDFLVNDGLQSQDSFGRWINEVITDSSGSVIDPVIEPSVSPSHNSYTNSTLDHHQSYVTDQIFNITDVSPAWAFSTEKTKILITGFFHTEYVHLMKSNMLVVCGDTSVNLDFVQPGVYRCLVQPHSPGLVHLYVSIDGLKPISQVLNFEYRTPFLQEPVVASELDHKREEFQVQMRLAHLLFSTSRSLNIMSSKLSPVAVNEAKKFAVRTSSISDSWIYFIKSIEENKAPFPQAKNGIFEIILRSRLREWLIERVAEGSKKSTEYDVKGQGVIHLCAILGYTWAVHLYVWSGLSIDFRDKFGWTALHWAAYYGRERMVAALLSVGSKPNLVTDPSSKNPGGCTAADLASMNGYDGLAAYLSEKALVSHFNQMSLAGNVSGSLETSTTDTANSYNISEEQLHMKDTLAAYRTAADAAARIQSAFRENSLKQRTQAIQFSTPEDEARGVIAAMKIQHAYRNFEIRKRMAAAARIQYRFRSWKLRREFLNKRRQVIRIQAAFRGFQVRRQYSKIIWSVGVLEKAILRWRLKRKGFRGLQVEPAEEVVEQQESGIEEDFYRVSQKQAEERIEKAVVRVQAMFRSKKAQEEYRRMKLTYDEAALEYEELSHFDTNMNS